MEVFITKKDCAERLGVSTQTISNYCEKGLISYRIINREHFIDKDSFTAFCEKYVKYIKADERAIEEFTKEIRQRKEEQERQLRELYKTNPITYQNNLRHVMAAACAMFKDYLNENEVAILSEFLLCKKDVTELARENDICKERVRQIARKAIKKIEELDIIAEKDKRIKELTLRSSIQHEHIKNLIKTVSKQRKLMLKMNRNVDNKIYDLETKSYVDSKNMSIPVSKCKFSVRVSNALSSAGIETLGDIVRQGKTNLLRIRNLGKGSIVEIEETLNAYDLTIY